MTTTTGEEEAHEAPHLARSMAAMTALTAVSRVTGFVLFVVVAAVLGTGLLGNTYQSANTIPNVLYDVVAAGVVQAVLIPSLVHRLDRGDREGADHVAGAVLGITAAALATVAVVGALLAPLAARLLFGGSTGAEHDAQVRAGTIFLWFFLPQVVCYAGGLVATSVLNARHRFALPAMAPLAGNVVVLASCFVYWRMRGGDSSSITGLEAVDYLVLAGGTTLGVVAFCGLPFLAARREGFRLRPNLDHRHPEVRRLGRDGAWAGGFLASTQILLVTVLLLGNRVPGGVLAYQLSFQFFLLPHALFAIPVLTTLFPLMARQHHGDDPAGLGGSVRRGVATIGYLLAPMAALLGALGSLISRTVLFGQVTPDGAALVAGCLAGFAPGLLGYGLFLFASRVSYAQGDTRTPTMVNLGVVAAGSVAMVGAYAALPERHRITGLALAHSAAYLGGAAVLLHRVVKALPAPHRPRLLASLGRPVLLGLVLAAVVALASHALGEVGRGAGLAAIATSAVLGLVTYVAATSALGGPAPSQFMAGLRGKG